VSGLDFGARLRELAPNGFIDGLRPAQVHALSEFAEYHTSSPDVGIELPTGEGKTLIGLLIADWALDQRMSVAYLTGNRMLATQVVRQAALLPGLETRRFEGGNYPGADLDDYHQAHAVGVMNYWVYFNSNPRVEPADLVIFDDAHLAEQALAGLFTASILRSTNTGRQLYETVCDLVLQRSPNSYPSLKALRDGAAPFGGPPELLAFNDWSAISADVDQAIASSAYLNEGSEIRYTWPSIRPYSKRCGVLVGPTSIEIRPYLPPTQTVPGYSKSTQRIYLSATLGSSGDLQRRLGTHPVASIETPRELCTALTGRRSFLINPGPEWALAEAPFSFALRQSEAAHRDGPGRVAWLCSSNAEADEIEARLLDRQISVFRLRGGDEAPFEIWRGTRDAHLVTAGRYDGLDLPGDTCHLVIIPSVPEASTEFERFVVAYLDDAGYMRHRVGQRLTQALGRANRTADDSGLYLGLDPGFAATLANRSVRSSMGSEVNAAVRRALELHGSGWEKVEVAANEFWSNHRIAAGGDTEEEANTSRQRPGRVRPGRARVQSDSSESAGYEVEAVTKLWLGDHEGAVSSAQHAAETLEFSGELEHSAFWRYVQAHALFDRGREVDVVDARRSLEGAVASAPRTAWFLRLNRTAEQLAGKNIDPTAHDPLFLAWDEWIREGSGQLPARIARARGCLSGTHDQRAEAIQLLARLCGVTGERPTGPSATDVRWAWATPRMGRRCVWEVKTGGSTSVPRSDVNQLLGQVKEEQGRSPNAKVVGCLLVVLDTVEGDAVRAARDEIVIMHEDGALALFDTMSELFASYMVTWGSGSTVERGNARSEIERRLPSVGWLGRLLSPTAGSILRSQDVRHLLEQPQMGVRGPL
jgi:hypothetical protein